LLDKDKEGNDVITTVEKSPLKDLDLTILLSVESSFLTRADWLVLWTLLEDDTNSRAKLTAGVGETDIDLVLLL